MEDNRPANSIDTSRRIANVLGINIDHVRKVTIVMEVDKPVLVDVQYIARNSDIECLEQELVENNV